MNSTELPLITVPLGRECHTKARELAAQTMQLTTLANKQQIGKRVYLNTLAVYAVDSYLRWQAYEPDLSQSDSADPILCSKWDVADLMIPGIGKLECRPMWEGESVVIVPSEATEDRIGYLPVQFGEHLDSAKLLGFAPAFNTSNPPKQLTFPNFQPLDAFIEYLYRLELANNFLQGNDPVAVRVREVLESNLFSEIVAQLERIWRSENDIEKPYAVKDILAGSTASLRTDRESISFDDEVEVELLELAENLLDKLETLWK